MTDILNADFKNENRDETKSHVNKRKQGLNHDALSLTIKDQTNISLIKTGLKCVVILVHKRIRDKILIFFHFLFPWRALPLALTRRFFFRQNDERKMFLDFMFYIIC